MSSPFYPWHNCRCAYQVHTPPSSVDSPVLLLIHPIGVGLSRRFWEPFIESWLKGDRPYRVYNPDLLGCGDSDMPAAAYYPSDWAEQLHYFVETVVKTPVVVVVQGALLPVAISLVQTSSDLIKGLVLAGPPAWGIITKEGTPWKQRLSWNLFFNSTVGNAFYRYARRRQFLRSFSERQLFAQNQDVDKQWLDTLEQGADDPRSRYAVFSFLAGFWRQDYSQAIAAIPQPTLVVVGEEATSIGRAGKSESPQERLDAYLKRLPKGTGKQVPGRNVLPYESTQEFVSVVAEFVEQI